eukprot:3250843-Pleurochrysis_carterae.AAC.2
MPGTHLRRQRELQPVCYTYNVKESMIWASAPLSCRNAMVRCDAPLPSVTGNFAFAAKAKPVTLGSGLALYGRSNRKSVGSPEAV